MPWRGRKRKVTTAIADAMTFCARVMRWRGGGSLLPPNEFSGGKNCRGLTETGPEQPWTLFREASAGRSALAQYHTRDFVRSWFI